MGVLAIWESSKTTFCDFGVGAHADLRTWREQRSVDVIPNKTVQRLEHLGSSLSWLSFENSDVPNHKSVASDRAHPAQNESRCLKKCSPLTLATLSTAGNSKHVEIAHQAAFQLRI
jgi:hypothetical protein